MNLWGCALFSSDRESLRESWRIPKRFPRIGLEISEEISPGFQNESKVFWPLSETKNLGRISTGIPIQIRNDGGKLALIQMISFIRAKCLKVRSSRKKTMFMGLTVINNLIVQQRYGTYLYKWDEGEKCNQQAGPCRLWHFQQVSIPHRITFRAVSGQSWSDSKSVCPALIKFLFAIGLVRIPPNLLEG